MVTSRNSRRSAATSRLRAAALSTTVFAVLIAGAPIEASAAFMGGGGRFGGGPMGGAMRGGPMMGSRIPTMPRPMPTPPHGPIGGFHHPHRGPVWTGYPVYPGPPRPPGWVEPAEDYAEEIVIRRPRRVPVLANPRLAPRPKAVAERVRPASASRAPKPAKPVQVAKPAQPAKATKQARPEPIRPTTTVAAAGQSYVPNEVLCEIRGNVPVATVDGIARGYGLDRVSWQRVDLADSTLYRYRIANGRPVEGIVRQLQADKRIASAQPNYLFTLQAGGFGGMPAEVQYASAKLHLQEAHKVATGAGVLVAVIDSGVDAGHPELAGTVWANVNALATPPRPEAHGTAIAGVIAAHAQLTGTAPAARLLAIRAFAAGDGKTGAQGTSADILRAVAVASDAGAKVVNMSFAGPSDPLLGRVLAAARQRGMIFVAAAGNDGPTAAPAYPAADPSVIAVTATDSRDRIFAAANRGAYVGVAAPGVDVLVAAPEGSYQLSSGTSIAAAHVTGIVAMMLERSPNLTPAEARTLLAAHALDLGTSGTDRDFGAGLVNPLATLDALPAVNLTVTPGQRVSDTGATDRVQPDSRLATVAGEGPR